MRGQSFFGWAFCYKRPVKQNDRDTRIPWPTQSKHDAISSLFPGSFSRCTSSIDFRWALHHFKSIREVYISMLKFTFRLLDWRFLSVMSAVAVGFLPQSQVNPQYGQNRHQKETRVRWDSFFFNWNVLKRIVQFKIYLQLHQAQFGCMEKVKLNLIIQQFEIQTVLKLLCFNEVIVW